MWPLVTLCSGLLSWLMSLETSEEVQLDLLCSEKHPLSTVSVSPM